jgi:hypothetical protein
MNNETIEKAIELVKNAMSDYLSNMFDDDFVSLCEELDDYTHDFLTDYNLRCYPLSCIDEEYEGKSVTTFLNDCIQFDISDNYYYHGDKGIFTLPDISAVAELYRDNFFMDSIVDLVIEYAGRINHLPTGLDYLNDMLANLEDMLESDDTEGYRDMEEVQKDIDKYMQM